MRTGSGRMMAVGQRRVRAAGTLDNWSGFTGFVWIREAAFCFWEVRP